MKNYKTSKDYKRLKELLDAGCKVICMDDDGNLGIAERNEYECYHFGGSFAMSYLIEEFFVQNCIDDGIEFIEPDTDSITMTCRAEPSVLSNMPGETVYTVNGPFWKEKDFPVALGEEFEVTIKRNAMSKDYIRLKALIDEGRTVPISLDIHTGHRIQYLARLDSDDMGIVCYNLGVGFWYTIHDQDGFTRQCEVYDVDFDEPKPSRAEYRSPESYPVKFGMHYDPDIHYEVDLNRGSRKIFLDGYTLGTKDMKESLTEWAKEAIKGTESLPCDNRSDVAARDAAVFTLNSLIKILKQM
jgi:hypothetical protein